MWPLIGSGICHAVQDFFKYGKILKSINATFITLVQKSEATDSFEAFRPISLSKTTHFIYKVIAKFLANRLSSIIGKRISPNQSAFIQGRGRILLAHELMQKFIIESDASKPKVDLQKFYSINLLQALVDLGFCGNRYCLKECISTAPTFSVLCNGTPFGFFGGIRQRDLFLLCCSVLRWRASPFLFKRG